MSDKCEICGFEHDEHQCHRCGCYYCVPDGYDPPDDCMCWPCRVIVDNELIAHLRSQLATQRREVLRKALKVAFDDTERLRATYGDNHQCVLGAMEVTDRIHELFKKARDELRRMASQPATEKTGDEQPEKEKNDD